MGQTRKTMFERVAILREKGLDNRTIADLVGISEEDVQFFHVKQVTESVTPIEIFVVWDLNADSWVGNRTFFGLHQTFEGAESSLPDSVKKLKRSESNPMYVADYIYYAIEKRNVGA